MMMVIIGNAIRGRAGGRLATRPRAKMASLCSTSHCFDDMDAHIRTNVFHIKCQDAEIHDNTCVIKV